MAAGPWRAVPSPQRPARGPVTGRAPPFASEPPAPGTQRGEARALVRFYCWRLSKCTTLTRGRGVPPTSPTPTVPTRPRPSSIYSIHIHCTQQVK